MPRVEGRGAAAGRPCGRPEIRGWQPYGRCTAHLVRMAHIRRAGERLAPPDGIGRCDGRAAPCARMGCGQVEKGWRPPFKKPWWGGRRQRASQATLAACAPPPPGCAAQLTDGHHIHTWTRAHTHKKGGGSVAAWAQVRAGPWGPRFCLEATADGARRPACAGLPCLPVAAPAAGVPTPSTDGGRAPRRARA